MENVTTCQKGFITMAFGQYYRQLAYNLFLSFKFNKIEYPFYVITDVKDEYTSVFDSIIYANDEKKGYMAKLELFDKTPFYETIYIDADCLLFTNNISKYFDLFGKTGCDFTCFGSNVQIDENYTVKGMFDSSKIKNLFNGKIKYIPNFCSTLYYFKKTDKAKQVFDCACELLRRQDDFGYAFYGDEPYISLSMAINNCICQEEYSGEYQVVMTRAVKVKASWNNHSLSNGYGYKVRKIMGEGRKSKEQKKKERINSKVRYYKDLIHFGTANTYLPFYKSMVGQLRNIDNIKYYFYKSKIVYGIRVSIHFIKAKSKQFFAFVKKCLSYIKRHYFTRKK